MDYSDFTTIQKVEKMFGLEQQRIQLFESIEPIAPSERLILDLEDAKTMSLSTEKAKSEFLIAPFLREVRRNAPDKVNIFSGMPLVVESVSLNGFCDFLISRNTISFELKTPIFCLVEAKNRTLEEGLGQCAAEMYAAQILNAQEDTPTECVFGAVTTGFDWIFLRLCNNIIGVDNQRYNLNAQLPTLLGVFQKIVHSF